MGLKQKEYEARLQGMAYARDLVKEKGLEALERECKMRGAMFIPLEVTEEQALQITDLVCTRTLGTMLPTTMFVLHDEFQFGKKRLERFGDNFTKRCRLMIEKDPFGAPYETVEDYAKELHERFGLVFDMESIEAIAKDNAEKEQRCGDMDYILDFLIKRGYPEAAEEIKKFM